MLVVNDPVDAFTNKHFSFRIGMVQHRGDALGVILMTLSQLAGTIFGV